MSNTRGSIRKTLLLWLLIPLISLCSLSAMVAYRLAEKFANDSYDRLLLKSAESIAARLGRNQQGIVVADLPKAAQAILRHNVKDEFYYQIADSYGHRLTGDADLPLPRDMVSAGPRFRYSEVEGQPVRMCRISVQISPSTDEIWVQVAESLNSRHHLLEQIFLSILAPQLVLVLLASLSVWLGVQHGLEPLERLRKHLEARGKIDLSPVEIGTTPAELQPVTHALNELFADANNHIYLQRQFIGNAAHQLRTPITALKTYVDYAARISNSDKDTLDTVLQRMSEAAVRVAHLVNRLLSLARSEEHSRKDFEILNLNDVVNDAGAIVVHEALQRDVIMEFHTPEDDSWIKADRGDIIELLVNLFDNAIRYTANKGFVVVKVEQTDSIVLTVEDNGSGIEDSQKQKIFERFYRIPETKGPGCGLGLSIVSEIATTNGANISIHDRVGGGTIFRVEFPSAAQRLLSENKNMLSRV